MLKKYKQKRNFNKTSEPKPNKTKLNQSKQPVFVVQEHHARNLHWDFRLEMDGVLKSWAIPKSPPLIPNQKRLAIQVEDHPLEYKDFEGEIPKNQYGAGKVIIWDKGEYQLLTQDKNRLEFKLQGKKLKGIYILLKPESFEPNNWLMWLKK